MTEAATTTSQVNPTYMWDPQGTHVVFECGEDCSRTGSKSTILTIIPILLITFTTALRCVGTPDIICRTIEKLKPGHFEQCAERTAACTAKATSQAMQRAFQGCAATPSLVSKRTICQQIAEFFTRRRADLVQK